MFRSGKLSAKLSPMSDFVHLHVHSEYSLLDGLCNIAELCTTAKSMGQQAIALTDHGVMHGAIEFYKRCKETGLKPIIGMEAYVSKGSHLIKERGGDYKDYNHLVLLASNYQGYQNLMQLTSIAHVEGFYYKPRFDKNNLEQYHEGLICLSGCLAGEVPEYLQLSEIEKARQTAIYFANLFGDGNYYLELQRHHYSDYINQAEEPQIINQLKKQQTQEDEVNRQLILLSRELGIPLVATNDIHYIKPEQAAVQDALVCIQTGKQVDDLNRMRYSDTPTFYLTSGKQMSQMFADVPEAISNTTIIADKCDVEIKLGAWYFPAFEIPGGKTAGEHLKDVAFQGAQSIYKNVTDEITERVNYELKVIEDRGYSPYFLIMADMVRWCREQGIVTTTRGSAAGSIILYCTGITEVDPLYYKLPFERFLNPFRPSPPDIDLDIADNRRGDLIAYLTQKYGAEKVAQICTFGRMLAKASVRDVGRVLGYPYSFPDKISKAIPEGSQGFPMTLKKALTQSRELAEMYQNNKEAAQIIDMAKDIEGNARHTSVHAAAVVISPEEMTKLSPVMKESGGEKIITQYEMHAAEEVGLIKFDILGIRNLAILNSAIDIVRETTGEVVDHKHIPMDDKATFEMLSRGETMGTFQLGGSGMTRYLMELKPERVEDIMAMIALFRPGPMANIPEYIRRKNDPTKVSYMHPKMANFLEASYGILVYQEDIMFTALELAGYDWGTVDKLRKAIGKKIPEEMARQEVIFIEGCMKHSNMDQALAQEIWDLFVPFQGYGFNKAHAAAYGIVAYQTAYMKAHYPVEFMTAVLTAESDNTDKLVMAINECKRMGLPVLPPDINSSDTMFTIVADKSSRFKKSIRFGLSAIKNVGVTAVEAIIDSRGDGKFVSLTDFMTRVDTRKVNKKVVESLIKVGAFDKFATRASMLAGFESVKEQAAKYHKTTASGQSGLFDAVTNGGQQRPTKDNLPYVAELPKTDLLNFEKELLGLYLTEHPLADAMEQIGQQVTHKLDSIDARLHVNTKVTVGGILASLRPIMTKKGNKPMAFGRLEDDTGQMDLVFFPKTWEQVGEKVEQDTPVLVTGKLESREDGLNLVVDRIRTISVSSPEDKNQYDQVITIPRGVDKLVLQQIGQLLKSKPGNSRIAVEIPNGQTQSKIVPLPYQVEWNQELDRQINSLLKVS